MAAILCGKVAPVPDPAGPDPRTSRALFILGDLAATAAAVMAAMGGRWVRAAALLLLAAGMTLGAVVPAGRHPVLRPVRIVLLAAGVALLVIEALRRTPAG
jgi:hypothetical protein